jgi:hypothetical protein
MPSGSILHVTRLENAEKSGNTKLCHWPSVVTCHFNSKGLRGLGRLLTLHCVTHGEGAAELLNGHKHRWCAFIGDNKVQTKSPGDWLVYVFPIPNSTEYPYFLRTIHCSGIHLSSPTATRPAPAPGDAPLRRCASYPKDIVVYFRECKVAPI